MREGFCGLPLWSRPALADKSDERHTVKPVACDQSIIGKRYRWSGTRVRKPSQPVPRSEIQLWLFCLALTAWTARRRCTLIMMLGQVRQEDVLYWSSISLGQAPRRMWRQLRALRLRRRMIACSRGVLAWSSGWEGRTAEGSSHKRNRVEPTSLKLIQHLCRGPGCPRKCCIKD